jgi:hypothetical protein
MLQLAEKVRESPARRYLPRPLMTPIHAFNRVTARRIERPSMAQRLRAELAAYLREDVDKLERFAGRRFPAWSL